MKNLKKGLALILAVLVMILSFPTVGFGASSADVMEIGEDSSNQTTDSEGENKKEETIAEPIISAESDSETDETDITTTEISVEEQQDSEQGTDSEAGEQPLKDASDEKTEETTDNKYQTENEVSNKDTNSKISEDTDAQCH